MSTSTAQKMCSLCNAAYTCADSIHNRTCLHYIWEVPHHFATKQGPMIRITRRPTDHHIFCKCVSSSGVVCNKTFASKSGLDKHLKNGQPVYWVAPDALAVALAAPQEVPPPLPVDKMAVDSEPSTSASGQSENLPSPGLSYVDEPDDNMDIAPLDNDVQPAPAASEVST
ncbi:hypothetical protein LXA43DRAFT_1061051 [Ganoderma leucocontextum]|nr:hypothetical protein LXA43DRAFT_1061051 [Ganoderma leucocontextum]